MLEPSFRHALSASSFSEQLLGKAAERPDLMDYVAYVEKQGENAEAGDVLLASRVLASQATTLDSMFTEFSRRSAINMGEYTDAADRYARLAMKAQANSRATLEALVKLHSPREQTVRHVHVNEGGQAVIADQFHHHTGGNENGYSDGQSHATGATGASAALLGPDAQGDTVPVPSRARKAAMPDARRD